MDTVALVSVIGSSSLALGSLVVGYLNSKEQRKHEASLAFESRAWERKSDALFRAIRAARAVCDSFKLDGDVARVDSLRQIEALRAELIDVLPVIEAYGSEQARDSLHRVRAVLGEVYFDPGWLPYIGDVRRRKADLIEARDFDAAHGLRVEEQRAMNELFKSLKWDPDRLEDALLALIDSARLSVRTDTAAD